MENFIENIAELLEEENVNLNDELTSFEAWDSLTVLSIIAFADEEYNVTLLADEINSANTIEGLFKLIQTKN
ncbi:MULTISPECIES: acyl carrier protein [Marinifilum]|uniref:acyl carrier protein n=1 Tax=Marinifilum TaxID=866673 RepID=UPI0006D0BD0F|nr:MULTISPECIES: acyl carrier protein [Marinifilum]